MPPSKSQTNKLQVKCNICLKIFPSPVHLKRHALVGCAIFSENELRTRECDDCYTTYSELENSLSLNLLTMHKRHCAYNTGKEPKYTICSVCGKDFNPFSDEDYFQGQDFQIKSRDSFYLDNFVSQCYGSTLIDKNRNFAMFLAAK